MDEITRYTVREVSDNIDNACQDLMDAIDDPMCEYIGRVVEAIAKKYNLNEEQAFSLNQRIFWRLDLDENQDPDQAKNDADKASAFCYDIPAIKSSVIQQQCEQLGVDVTDIKLEAVKEDDLRGLPTI